MFAKFTGVLLALLFGMTTTVVASNSRLEIRHPDTLRVLVVAPETANQEAPSYLQEEDSWVLTVPLPVFLDDAMLPWPFVVKANVVEDGVHELDVKIEMGSEPLLGNYKFNAKRGEPIVLEVMPGWERGKLRITEVARFTKGSELELARAPSLEPSETPFVYYVSGNTLRRISVPALRDEEVFTVAESQMPESLSDFSVSHGNAAWVTRKGKRVKLMYYRDGVLREFDLPSYKVIPEVDDYGMFVRESDQTSGLAFTGLRLTKGGRRLVWNENLRTVCKYHENCKCELGCYNNPCRKVHRIRVTEGDIAEVIFEESYMVHMYHKEERRLTAGPVAEPDAIYFFRLIHGQLSSFQEDLFKVIPGKETAELIEPGDLTAIAYSPDGRFSVTTPPDQHSCGLLLYRNDFLDLVDRATGERVRVFDEWGEFENKPPKSGPNPGGADFDVRTAIFSPDGGKLLIGLNKYVESSENSWDHTVEYIYSVRSVKEGVKGDWIEGGRVLGWADSKTVVVGTKERIERKTRSGHMGSRMEWTSLWLRDVGSGKERPIPIGDGYALKLGF